jgi:hypothetical protein
LKTKGRSIFGALKKRRQYQLPLEMENCSLTGIVMVYRDFGTTMIGMNVFAAFRHIGCTFHIPLQSGR